MFGNPSDPAMNMVPGTTYRSPKRKRDVIEEFEEGTPPASPTSTLSAASHPEMRLLEAEELGRYSPRTVVAGRFKELAIHEGVSHSIPIAQWHGPSDAIAASSESPVQAVHATPSTQKSPKKTSQPVISNEDRPNGEHIIHDETSSTMQPAEQHSDIEVKSASPAKPRRKKSPPPDESAIMESLTWDDSEITGHDPTDPNDDGYGINGIGFKPTAAIAWARSQQRQKQVAEWKNREAREAREKRRERREGVSHVKPDHDPGGAVQKKVKFDLH